LILFSERIKQWFYQPKGEIPMNEEKKEAYEQKMEARLKEWDAKIQQLKAKAEQASAEARIEYNNRIEELQGKRKTLEDRLDEMKSSGGDAWKDIKAGVENAFSDLKISVESAIDRFK